MSFTTPPSTTLSDPPSPTELPTSNLPPGDDSDEGPTMLTPNSKRIIKTTETLITPIFMRPKPIYVIVATALNPPMGIGNKGNLPWPGIKADMAFFRQLTSYVPADDSAKARALNAVVMGRKTWESIPPKFRPLAGRLNVIITRGSSSELGKRILEDMKNNARGPKWEMHQLTATKVKPRSKSKTAEQGTTTVLTASSHSSSPIMISQSLPSALSFLSSPAPVLLSPSDSAPTSNPAAVASSDSILINNIFCIGGAEIYRQVLALSSHSPQSPSTPTGPGSETGTDTEGEVSDSHKGGKHFDVRILQTQIRKPASQTSASSTIQHPDQRRKSRVEEPDFVCDTFFPDLLPSTGSGVKSTKWRPAPQEKVGEWIGDEIDLPQHAGRRKESVQAEQLEQVEEDSDEEEEDEDNHVGPEVAENELWLKDDKAGVEIRVVGWQRR